MTIKNQNTSLDLFSSKDDPQVGATSLERIKTVFLAMGSNLSRKIRLNRPDFKTIADFLDDQKNQPGGDFSCPLMTAEFAEGDEAEYTVKPIKFVGKHNIY